MNTAKQIGGALGLAVLTAAIAGRGGAPGALAGAYGDAFLVMAGLLLAVAVALLALPAGPVDAGLPSQKREWFITRMTDADRKLSTREERRATVMRAATGVFAARGYYGTTTAEVADRAGVSQPYLYRLYPDKESLFVAVVEHCGTRILECLAEGASHVRSGDPEAVLFAMGDEYARMVADRDLVMLFMQAVSAAREPAIGDAMRGLYARAVEYVRSVSGASDEAIQLFFMRGFWCNTVAALETGNVEEPWARTLTHGLLRYPPQAS
jgi:AcrR family transcriptional regulator